MSAVEAAPDMSIERARALNDAMCAAYFWTIGAEQQRPDVTLLADAALPDLYRAVDVVRAANAAAVAAPRPPGQPVTLTVTPGQGLVLKLFNAVQQGMFG